MVVNKAENHNNALNNKNNSSSCSLNQTQAASSPLNAAVSEIKKNCIPEEPEEDNYTDTSRKRNFNPFNIAAQSLNNQSFENEVMSDKNLNEHNPTLKNPNNKSTELGALGTSKIICEDLPKTSLDIQLVRSPTNSFKFEKPLEPIRHLKRHHFLSDKGDKSDTTSFSGSATCINTDENTYSVSYKSSDSYPKTITCTENLCSSSDTNNSITQHNNDQNIHNNEEISILNPKLLTIIPDEDEKLKSLLKEIIKKKKIISNSANFVFNKVTYTNQLQYKDQLILNKKTKREDKEKIREEKNKKLEEQKIKKLKKKEDKLKSLNNKAKKKKTKNIVLSPNAKLTFTKPDLNETKPLSVRKLSNADSLSNMDDKSPSKQFYYNNTATENYKSSYGPIDLDVFPNIRCDNLFCQTPSPLSSKFSVFDFSKKSLNYFQNSISNNIHNTQSPNINGFFYKSNYYDTSYMKDRTMFEYNGKGVDDEE